MLSSFYFIAFFAIQVSSTVRNSTLYSEKCLNLTSCENKFRDCILNDSIRPFLRPRFVEWAENVCEKGFKNNLKSGYENKWFDGCCETCCKMLAETNDDGEEFSGSGSAFDGKVFSESGSGFLSKITTTKTTTLSTATPKTTASEKSQLLAYAPSSYSETGPFYIYKIPENQDDSSPKKLLVLDRPFVSKMHSFPD